MNKISLVLLTLLFSASIASAETFKVKAQNFGVDSLGTQTKVFAKTTTKTTPKDPNIGLPRVDVDVILNEIDTISIGANANHKVEVDPDCIACADKLYDDVDVEADNYGDVEALTETLTSIGVVQENFIQNTAIGSSGSGSYANFDKSQTLTNTTPVSTTTFHVVSKNHGVDSEGNTTTVKAIVNTYTGYERIEAGTPAETDFQGGNVIGNEIDNTAIGANSSMDVQFNVDFEANGRFYTEVQTSSLNYGDVIATTNTFSSVGDVRENFIGTTSIGANASGSWTNQHPISTP